MCVCVYEKIGVHVDDVCVYTHNVDVTRERRV